jgi:FtsP/CotA-like multicopper oxidase with cupredoxin domain/DNA-binding beta-propeller fold protein YncE/plastocyanin
MLSFALTSVFAFESNKTNFSDTSTNVLPFMAQAVDYEPIQHNIEMEAVKMPDGLYAYRMLSYETSEGRDLVEEGVYNTKPSIPGPTLVFTETDVVNLRLYNNACDDFVVDNAGENENSLVGIHVHGVHYDISDDATYQRMNMSDQPSAASCDSYVDYFWSIDVGTKGTWPYHDHTFKINEIGAEEVGLFGTVIVNPSNGILHGLVNDNTGRTQNVKVERVDKEFVLWMVSSEELGRSVFYGMEIDNKHPSTPGKQTALWVNPPLYSEEGKIVRYHVLGLGEETHAFHLHGHRWVDDSFNRNELIDVKEITPLQRHSFIIKTSSNDGADTTSGNEGWMYHCHFVDHMKAGMSGMMHIVDNDTLPDIGAVFTLSDEPGLWFKTLDAGILDTLDDDLNTATAGLIPSRAGTGFPLDYLAPLSPEFGDTQGRSLAVIEPGQTVLFNMKDSQTKHTITTLIWPENASPLGGNGVVQNALADPIGHFDTQLGIRGSTFLVDDNAEPAPLTEEGLYVFVCKIHPYMFSAVIVDDADTYIQTDVGPIPLLDLGENVTILTRVGADFPVTVPSTSDIPVHLLKTFFIVTDPANWKDYTKEWNVNFPPAPLTSNDNETWAFLTSKDNVLNIIAPVLNPRTPAGNFPPSNDLFLLDADVKTNLSVSEPSAKGVYGVGELWVNTQFERTFNKNPEGTPYDKPGTITVVDVQDWTIERKIALPEINMNHPHNMWSDAKNEVVYQTQWFDSRMVTIDRESGEMVKDMFVGQSPSHVMTAPDGDNEGNVYIAMNGEEQVVEIDPNTLEITRQISTGPRSHPHGHWISSDGSKMVTPDFIGLSSSIIDLDAGTVTKATHSAPLPPGLPDTLLLGPIATGMMGDGSKYYTADFLGNTLSSIDLTTGKITNQIDLVANGTGLPIQTPVSPDDKWLVTANVLFSKITVVDTSTEKVVAVLDCDPGCHGVQWGAKDGDGYLAYVSNKFSNALIVVDPKSGSDAEIVGKIVLAKEFDTFTDDKIMTYAGMGGQGVLAVPNVYEGWIQQTVEECGATKDPCSQEIIDFLDNLTGPQKNPNP